MPLARSDLDDLFSATYEELRRLAAAVGRDDPSATLNPTALVDEVALRRNDAGLVTDVAGLRRRAGRGRARTDSRSIVLGMMRTPLLMAATALVVVLTPGPDDRQSDAWSTARLDDDPPSFQMANVPYNGDFTFTRIRYSGGGRGRGYGGGSWAHDYPAADRNMQVMLNEFTAMRANTTSSNVFDLEDPEIYRNPVLYVSEPGFWRITPEGAAALRDHLLKGGFIMFDDFEAGQWYNMADQMAQVLPEGQWVEIDETHPIFSTFFYVENIYVPHPLVRVTPVYRVIFEDNDPAERIMVLANHNSDLAEYWEYAAQGYFPVDPTNDAFRLGINYFMYGVTH